MPVCAARATWDGCGETGENVGKEEFWGGQLALPKTPPFIQEPA
jgi:hypothetical protein